MRVALFVAISILASSTFAPSFAPAQERAPGDAGEAKKKPAEAAPGAPAGPDSTTETFGDWSIVCSAGGRRCRGAHLRGRHVHHSARSDFAVRADRGRAPVKGQASAHRCACPGEYHHDRARQDRRRFGKFELGLSFKSCVPAGCLAESELSKEQLQAFRASAKSAGQLTLVDASGKSATLQMSLRGLDQALDAYFKAQERQP